MCVGWNGWVGACVWGVGGWVGACVWGAGEWVGWCMCVGWVCGLVHVCGMGELVHVCVWFGWVGGLVHVCGVCVCVWVGARVCGGRVGVWVGACVWCVGVASITFLAIPVGSLCFRAKQSCCYIRDGQ